MHVIRAIVSGVLSSQTLSSALSAQEFRDVLVFRAPPLLIQGMIFGTLAPIARGRGYRATYPQLSRTTLAPRV